MDPIQYLQRINFTSRIGIDAATLNALHRHHVFQIPFENIDVYDRKLFELTPTNVFQKVVRNWRGGFCYELNLLFHELLRILGFQSNLIEARIITDDGAIGPRYDHMCIHVKLDEEDYLADVGFGDLFVTPLNLKMKCQTDGRNYFRLEHSNGMYQLSMSETSSDFSMKYIFCLDPQPVSAFESICLEKQISPDSYFVRNLVCTLPTENGRVTIFNNKLIEKSNGVRKEIIVQDDLQLRQLLNTWFKIPLPTSSSSAP